MNSFFIHPDGSGTDTNELLQCAITGKWYKKGIFYIHDHHYIKEQQYEKDPEWFERQGIKQRIIPLHFRVHDSLHHQSEKTFLKTYSDLYREFTGKELRRYDFLWNRKEWFANEYGS